MKIIVLVENHGDGIFGGEHGLSVYMEYGGHHILLDTGTTDLYEKNAAALGVDLNSVDFAVLSHGHYDHSGGFRSFFEKNTEAQVYLQDSCQECCYRMGSTGRKYIGIPHGLLEEYDGRFSYVAGDKKLAEGIWLIAHHTPGLERRGAWAGMYRLENGQWQWDDFSHEQSLVFESPKGLVIFNSCCHAGADVIIEEVQSVFAGAHIHCIMGGFHLKDVMRHGRISETMPQDANGRAWDQVPENAGSGRAQVEALGHRLKALAVDAIYTGHCTGDEAYDILKDILGDRLHPLHSGLILQL